MQDTPEPSPAAEYWPTSVTDIEGDRIAIRGYPIEELMGRVSLSEAIGLIFLGEVPDKSVASLLDAILVASLDHGTTSPSALVSRLAASTGAEVGHAAASGLLAINQYHGGALALCMAVLQDVVDRHEAGDTLQEAARKLVADWRARGERIPGFGHRVHGVDPRVARLFDIADELGFRTIYQDAARAIEQALNDSNKRIPMNLDGAIAAIFCGTAIPVGLANSIFMVARYVGLNAQAYEEKTRMRPMRKIRPDLYRYDGPSLRRLDMASQAQSR